MSRYGGGMRVRVTQREVQPQGWRGTLRAMANPRRLRGTSFAGFTDRSGSSEDGEPVVDYMIHNEEGTATIPERPFMSQAYQAHLDEYERRMDAGALAVAEGRQAARQVLAPLARDARNHIIREILSPSVPFEPNAPATVAAKGSSRPLVDTGLAVGRVVWEVED